MKKSHLAGKTDCTVPGVFVCPDCMGDCCPCFMENEGGTMWIGARCWDCYLRAIKRIERIGKARDS